MWPTRLLLALALTTLIAPAAQAQPQETFDFQWTSITNVGLWPANRIAAPPPSPDRVQRGAGILTLAGNQPGAAFAFDFRGRTDSETNASGSGLVLSDGRTLDSNFAFPSAAVPELPAGQVRRVLAGFRRLGPVVEMHFIEVFICRDVPERCGGVRHMERVFIGIGRRAP